jgi:hypothetical protein
MSMMKWAMVGTLIATLTSGAHAQTLTREGTITAAATITAIDSATRSLTLKNDKGEEDTFTAGPEVTRFSQLKVGDKIRLTYHESLVLQLRKPGAASNSTGDTAAAGRTQAVPGGAVATQQTRTVTVKAVDPKVPSITVATADGHTVTRKVEDKKNIENVAVGDRIDITYTQAVVVNAEPAK